LAHFRNKILQLLASLRRGRLVRLGLFRRVAGSQSVEPQLQRLLLALVFRTAQETLPETDDRLCVGLAGLLYLFVVTHTNKEVRNRQK
jgi:hypothetical protein